MPTPVIEKQTPDLGAMTIDQLQAEALRLADVLDLANDQRRQIFELIDTRKADVSAKARVAGLSDIETDALKSVLTKP